MYVTGFITPVPEDKREAYLRWAEMSAEILKDYGCIEIVEAWEDNIPNGKVTDFRRAVQAQPGEKIVLSWKIWPDKESLEEGEAKLHESGRLDTGGEPPFDARRLVLGCFESVFTMGRP